MFFYVSFLLFDILGKLLHLTLCIYRYSRTIRLKTRYTVLLSQVLFTYALYLEEKVIENIVYIYSLVLQCLTKTAAKVI